MHLAVNLGVLWTWQLIKEYLSMGSLSISIVFCRIILIAGWYCNLKFHPQASVPHPPVDTVATQWHKRILSDFSLELEGRTASSYQGCISKASAGKWIGYFPSERQSGQGEKKKKKTNRPLSISIFRGESFWSLSYPVLLQPESQASPGQGADPQAG